MTAAEKLRRMRNRATLYELVMTDGAETLLVCYTQDKTRKALWNGVTDARRVQKIVAKTGADELTFAGKTADGATMGAWTIQFSGRTQRDAIAEGELPYVGRQD